jgi:hypothetical protein
MGQYTIRNDLAVRDALARACARQELMILVTPYLRFESSFVGLDDTGLHAQVTMSLDEAIYGLHAPELKMRFPHGTGFLEARTQLLGMGTWNGKQTIRLAVPPSMEDDDHRGAYRVDLLEDVRVQFEDGHGAPAAGHVVNLSATGARVEAEVPVADLALAQGLTIACRVLLEEGLPFEARGLIRHVRGATLGLEFVPPLPPDVLEPLNRWIFRRREAEAERRSLLALEEAEGRHGEDVTTCLLLLSQDRRLELALRAIFKGMPPLIRCEPGIKSLKDALEFHPELLVFHFGQDTPEERMRLCMLAEYLGGRWPFIILGTGVDNATLFELSRELKPAGTFLLTDSGSGFFPRLVQGILRRLGTR